MSFTTIVLAGFYDPARHAIHYADGLALAVRGQVVLLHVNRVSYIDPYELVGPVGTKYHREELQAHSETANALRQLAQDLNAPATVEMATDLLPEVARELAARYHPALFVMGQPDQDHPDYAGITATCAELLRAGNYPVLVVPTGAPLDEPPHRLLIGADREPFALGPQSQALWPALAQLGSKVVVAHVSTGIPDDDGCAAAYHAVRASGLVDFMVPELHGYQASDFAEGLLNAAREAQADLVIVLARERSFMSELFHRSVTARLLKRSHVPILVLPTAATVPDVSASPPHQRR